MTKTADKTLQKFRRERAIGRYVLNPVVKGLSRLGLRTALATEIETVGRKGTLLQLKRLEHERSRQIAEIEADGRIHRVVLPLAGEFQMANALTAAGLAIVTGVAPETALGALETLKGRARIKRTMWSRRAQEYEAKIDSGDLVSIAEVVRDLHRAGGQPEQSYSERQLYEKALARMAREVAAVEKTDEPTAVKRVEGMLTKKAA